MLTTNQLNELKTILRENWSPVFTDDELNMYYEKNNRDMNRTIYECLVIKSEDTTLQIAGMTSADSSKYYRRLANMYKPSNSGILKRE